MLPVTVGDSDRTRRLCVLLAACAVLLGGALCPRPALAEDGYDLWLRYRPMVGETAQAYRAGATELVAGADSPTQAATRAELLRGLGGLLGAPPPIPDARIGAGLGGLILVAAVLLPVLGLSLLAVALVERLFLTRWGAARRWLGLRGA